MSLKRFEYDEYDYIPGLNYNYGSDEDVLDGYWNVNVLGGIRMMTSMSDIPLYDVLSKPL